MIESNTPILVGCGQATLRNEEKRSVSCLSELVQIAVQNAAVDTGLGAELFEHVDGLACVHGLQVGAQNLASNLANNFKLENSTRLFRSTAGGNSPQWLLNLFAQKISQGVLDTVILAGGEMLGGEEKAVYSSELIGGRSVKEIGDIRLGSNQYEIAHGLMLPSQMYPLFENALCHHYGHSRRLHAQKLGELYAYFSQVAADNPYAWSPSPLSAEEIINPNANNHYIAYPYTRHMNAMIAVSQSAALALTSVKTARKLGIDESRWVFIHGVSDTHDHWFPSERNNFYSSPGLGLAAKKAFLMAEKTIDDMDFIDLYSCYPSAVEIARDELGISDDDLRHLTVTGGLRFHGGPGNNYAMHSIAHSMDLVRRTPGAWSLVTAMGWHLTKHSFGIYSTEPFEGRWSRQDPVEYQSDLDVLPSTELVLFPRGAATIETYTVTFDCNGRPEKGIVVGLLEDNRRFLAHTPEDPIVCEQLMRDDVIGNTGYVSPHGEVNLFQLD